MGRKDQPTGTPAARIPGRTEAAPPTLAPGSISIRGAGATFPLPVYTEWMYAYQYVDPAVVISYQGIGSSGGKKGILDGSLDFAGSDSILTDEQYAQGEDLQMYPIVAGAVVLIYNIENLDLDQRPALILDRQGLVDIYQGKITTWNDPAITALNPEIKDGLPAQPITTVHRSDGSGTTEIFTSALSLFSEDWKRNVGAGSEVQWPGSDTPTRLSSKGNQGVAASVRATPNSIGYVELSYAIANQIPYARMVNKAGKLVGANASSLTAAMEDFASNIGEQLTVKIVDGEGAGSWPIAGYTYIILHTRSMQDCVKVEKLTTYLQWTLTDSIAAKRAADLGYAVLSNSVREKVLAKLKDVTCQVH